MKYVIVKRFDQDLDPLWTSHKYNYWFKAFGAQRYDYISRSTKSPDECESRLRAIKSGADSKYEVIRIVEV